MDTAIYDTQNNPAIRPPMVRVTVLSDGFSYGKQNFQKWERFTAELDSELMIARNAEQISFFQNIQTGNAVAVIYTGVDNAKWFPSDNGYVSPGNVAARCVPVTVSEIQAEEIMKRNIGFQYYETHDAVVISGNATVDNFETDIIPHIPQRPRILIIRDNGAGDVIMSIPAVRELKRTLPDSTIEYATLPRHLELLYGMDCIDTHRDVHGIDFVKEKFDLIINWANGIEDYREARNCGPRIDSFALSLGLRLTDHKTELHPVPVYDIPERDIVLGDKCIAYVMQAATWNRTWPMWKVRDLCRLFERELPDYSIVLIDSQEFNFLDAPNVINLCGKTGSLVEASLAAASCDLVISQDTGIVHAVAALEPYTPQLVLIGSMKPEWRFSHYPAVQWIHPAGRVDCCPCLDWNIAYPDGRLMSCQTTKRNLCLESITPEEIVQKAKEMLK